MALMRVLDALLKQVRILVLGVMREQLDQAGLEEIGLVSSEVKRIIEE